MTRHLLDTQLDHHRSFFCSKEVPRLDSVKPLEKHYSVILPTVSHSGFLYKTASAGKPLQDRRAREGERCAVPTRARVSVLAWLQGQDARTDSAGGLRVPSGLWCGCFSLTLLGGVLHPAPNKHTEAYYLQMPGLSLAYFLQMPSLS